MPVKIKRWYDAFIKLMYTIEGILLLLFALFGLCFMFNFLNPNFKSESIFDLIVNNVANLVVTGGVAVGLVEYYDRKRRKKQALVDWISHLEDLYVSLRGNLLATESTDDVYSKVFIEESKVLNDYLNQTYELFAEHKNMLSDDVFDILYEMCLDASDLSEESTNLLNADDHQKYKNDILLSMLGRLHINITTISACTILTKSHKDRK